MTTGILDVKDLAFFIDPTGGTSFVAIGCATDASLSFSKELREIICKQNAGGIDLAPSLLKWSGSFSGLLAFDATFGGVDVVDLLIAGTRLNIKFSTSETGDVNYIGEVYLESAELGSSGASGDNATFSGSFRGIGVPVKGVNV